MSETAFVDVTLSPDDLAAGLTEAELALLVSRCEAMATLLAPGREVSLVLCDDPTIAALNARWRGIDKPTDVLSFAQDEMDDDVPQIVGGPDDGPLPLGDVIISVPTAHRQAGEQGWPLADELTFLAAHGLCHLVGMDHAAPAEAAEMAAQESRMLAIFGLERPFGRGF